MARQLGLAPATAPLALLGQGLVEPGPVDPDAVLGRQLDRQVDREAIRVVQPERDVARQHGRVVRQVLGPRARSVRSRW